MYSAKHARRHRTVKQVAVNVIASYLSAVVGIVGAATYANTTSADLTPTATEVQCVETSSTTFEKRKVLRKGHTYRPLTVQDYWIVQRRSLTTTTTVCDDGTETSSATLGRWRYIRTIILNPCPNDDGDAAGPCVWDAVHFGNGKGQSFRITRGGNVKDVSHRKAHRLWIAVNLA